MSATPIYIPIRKSSRYLLLNPRFSCKHVVFPLYKELFVLFPRMFPRIIVMVELDGKYIVQLFNLYRSLLKSYPNLRYAQDFIGIIQWSTTNRFAIVTNNDF